VVYIVKNREMLVRQMFRLMNFVRFAANAALWKMDYSYHFSKFILSAILIAGISTLPYQIISGSTPTLVVKSIGSDTWENPGTTATDKYLKEQNDVLLALLYKRNVPESTKEAKKILRYIVANEAAAIDSTILGNSYYLLGASSILSDKYDEALHYLGIARDFKERRNEIDGRYSRILYNIGVVYDRLEDWNNAKKYSLASLEVDKKLYGSNSPDLIQTYANIISACIGLKEYDQIREFSNAALEISDKNIEVVEKSALFTIYMNRGVSLIHLADYTKAKVYFEKAELIYYNNSLPFDENALALLANLAITYGFLGMTEKSNQYYEKGILLSEKFKSYGVFSHISNYAISLAKQGKKAKGESLLKDALDRVKRESGTESVVYIRMLANYAGYLRDVLHEPGKACKLYEICLQKLNKSSNSHLIKNPIYFGYSLALSDSGEITKALEIIQNILWSESSASFHENVDKNSFSNPEIENLTPDKLTLLLLQAKYMVLWKYYQNSHEEKMLLDAASTAKVLIGVLERVRMNISEEDSRLILGDRFRDAYINAIHINSYLYNKTGKREYLETAYEFTEKSKVAGLLASARELNASHFNIPPDLGELENRLRQKISLLNAGIEDELHVSHPDTAVIGNLKEKMLFLSQRRDSLISVFEKKYPGYYSFKYSNSVTKLNDLPSIIGKDVNYLNYVASDTAMLIFVSNRKEAHLIVVNIDSTFYTDIRHFRSLLGMPSPTSNAREDFRSYVETGYRIYKKIIEPVIPYLISNKLLISPDNILSYIPFETLPVSEVGISGFSYARLPYMMNKYEISYTYSVTFMAESLKRKSRLSNKLAAFAPDYDRPIDLNTVMLNRQTVNGFLPDLPYARQEAEYVSKVTGGTLFESNMAREAVFKDVSVQYDIIHLAMHTILNDKDPMYSTLIFGADKDTLEDRYMRAYEVYSIPLRAKMVVLSSCNSGAGYLYSGEGILSLARGFLYSGSASVVMAMWEIEDRSGTEIVKNFYDNLKKGYSKSAALRTARMKYLRDADQLRSHPYFWSTLVIYGNNKPLYFSRFLRLTILLGIIAVISAPAIYFWRRKYS
jgi:CHAT domain-containing protein